MGFGGRRGGGHFASLIEEEEQKERPKIASDWTLAKWIIGFMFREFKGLVVIALVLVGLSSVINLVSPLIMRYLIDDVFDLTNAFTTEKRLTYLLFLTLSLLGVALITAVLSIFRTI
nr:hypothetical protein [Asgard group archaeon]